MNLNGKKFFDPFKSEGGNSQRYYFSALPSMIFSYNASRLLDKIYGGIISYFM